MHAALQNVVKMNEIQYIIEERGRATGRTTRLADAFIQELFKTGHTKIYDHYNSRQAHFRLFNIICQRLELEHGGRNHFQFHPKSLEIKIKKL